MTERRIQDRRGKQRIFHFPKIVIGRKLWLCLIALVLMLGGYVHANLRGSENYSTYVWGILGVLGIFSGASVTQKFSPYSSMTGMGMNGYNTGYTPPINQGQYPVFNPVSQINSGGNIAPIVTPNK